MRAGRVTGGTKLADGTVVVRGDANSIGKIRCMRCHGMASLTIRSDGKKVYRCDNCGREWVTVKY